MENIERLLERVKQGCRKSERELYDLLKKQLDSFLLYLVRDDAQREEVIHCALIKVFLQVHRFDDSRGIKFKTWVFRIARNTALTWLRLNKKFLSHVDLDVCPPVSLGLDEKLDLERALMILPEKYRVPTLLRYRDDLSYDEVAKALGIKLNTLKSLLLRAHQKLRSDI